MLCAVRVAGAQETRSTFKAIDVFELEYASDPRISPDGKHVVYVRTSMNIMKDRRTTRLWVVNTDGSNHRPLTSGKGDETSPRWSPDGTRILYASSRDDATQLYVRWMDSGQTAQLTNLTQKARSLSWSPNGDWIAFSMLVEAPAETFAKMPRQPEGAEWAEPPRVVQKLIYRADGRGYVEDGYEHLFVLTAEGGTPRQVTHGPFHHAGTVSWSADGQTLFFAANRSNDWEYEPRNSDVYALSLSDGTLRQLTTRFGPDRNPVVSPDGSKVAYLGYDDRLRSYELTRLHIMNIDGTDARTIATTLERSVRQPQWSADGRRLYFLFDDAGNTKVGSARVSGGEVEVLAHDVGGTSLGRPYSSGSFSLARNGRFAFTLTSPGHPADVAWARSASSGVQRLTRLNDDLLAFRQLGTTEEIWYESSHDGRRIQGWIVHPPHFDPTRRYPLLLEIHGGPFANYGGRFSTEVQLYAAAGYVVLYTNPRGSTSYGEEFANLIHHRYPGDDYADLMSGVDAVIERGSIDPNNLFVTGGSGGGVLTSWIVGKTDRFRAAVVAKPVINWTSFVLTADHYNMFYKYWFPGFPWDHPEHYLERSPLSLVGNVTTPTMLLTGEADLRTPMSESEQYYQALKLRRVETALVRIPGASHGIASRPSNLIAKVTHILEWFDRHRLDGPNHTTTER
ncbi:MAG: S9 family peptidase [Candidatus Latescibacterota bacterium]|nr:MAG: S9 family peptidase [Candidatus Latescibacterota bacterium]